MITLLLACAGTSPVADPVPVGPPADRTWQNVYASATDGQWVAGIEAEPYGQGEGGWVWCVDAGAPSGSVADIGHHCLRSDRSYPSHVTFHDGAMLTSHTSTAIGTQWFDPTPENRGADALTESSWDLLFTPCSPDLDHDGASDLVLLGRGGQDGFPDSVGVWFSSVGTAVEAEPDAVARPSAGNYHSTFALRDAAGRDQLVITSVLGLEDADMRAAMFRDGPAEPPLETVAWVAPLAVGDLGATPGEEVLLADRKELNIAEAELYAHGDAGLVPTGVWVEPVGELGPWQVYAVAGDFDGDGVDDLALSDTLSVSIFRGPLPPGRSTLADADLVLSDPKYENIRSLLAPDLDGDGRAELIVGGSDTAAVTTSQAGVTRIWNGTSLFP